jgi:hypothetical protein
MSDRVAQRAAARRVGSSLATLGRADSRGSTSEGRTSAGSKAEATGGRGHDKRATAPEPSRRLLVGESTSAAADMDPDDPCRQYDRLDPRRRAAGPHDHVCGSESRRHPRSARRRTNPSSRNTVFVTAAPRARAFRPRPVVRARPASRCRGVWPVEDDVERVGGVGQRVVGGHHVCELGPGGSPTSQGSRRPLDQAYQQRARPNSAGELAAGSGRSTWLPGPQ